MKFIGEKFHKLQSSLIVFPVILFVFLGFVWFYESFTLTSAREKTQQYSQLLNMPLHEIDKASITVCSYFLVKTGDYRSVAVFHSNGNEPFVKVSNEFNNGYLDRFFVSIKLIRNYMIESPIVYNGQTVGRLEAVWINKNIYTYFYTLFFLLVIGRMFQYYIRLSSSRQELERNYAELNQQIVERKRVDEELYKSHIELEQRVKERTLELSEIVENLSEQILERKRAEEKLEASLEEKEVLLKEIHHRVKNNLQVISSLLNLQSEKIDDKHLLEIFKESQNRIQAMARIHEELYQSKDLSRINFAVYSRKLVDNLFHSYQLSKNKIKLKMDIDDISLNIKTAIPCGMIVNEIISNSLKFAFPNEQSGEILFSVKRNSSEKIVLLISDNGVGFHLDIENADSLGLHLIHILTQQINGKLDFQSNEKTGTKFEISFKE